MRSLQTNSVGHWILPAALLVLLLNDSCRGQPGWNTGLSRRASRGRVEPAGEAGAFRNVPPSGQRDPGSRTVFSTAGIDTTPADAKPGSGVGLFPSHTHWVSAGREHVGPERMRPRLNQPSPFTIQSGPTTTTQSGPTTTTQSAPTTTVAPSSLWSFQHMPDGLLYSSYLAGPRESRIGGAWLANSDGPDVNDVTLGGRVGILRWGTDDPQWPEGWQLDIEGAAFPRLNLDEDADVDATDFRFGIPLSWRRGQWQAKFAFYHLSSHAGDEFIERNPDFDRINFSRNALVLGVGYFATPDLRLYAEADFGVSTDGGADPWWFQFGFDYAPSQPTGLTGAPFVAANGFLREEADFGGTFTLMAGWAWRADRSGHLYRIGLQYSDGHTTQLEFQQESEQLVGLGIWYDF